jgi:3-deoxy-D-manno-octulosonate 8-phosphate phosphatase (KDO 8-P phosphatase)
LLQRVLEKAGRIKLIGFDVDGVLTDGRIILGNNGEELKFFSAHDGTGIIKAIEKGLKVTIITSRSSKLVQRRADELGVTELYQNIHDKLSVFDELRKKYNYSWDETCFVGDDIYDLPVLEKCGLPVAVANAMPVVKKKADYITTKKGGHGAAREIIDIILFCQNRNTGYHHS